MIREVNDRIVEVNGVRNDANAIVSKLKRDTVWTPKPGFS